MGPVPAQELRFQRQRLLLLSECPDLEKIKLVVVFNGIKIKIKIFAKKMIKLY